MITDNNSQNTVAPTNANTTNMTNSLLQLRTLCSNVNNALVEVAKNFNQTMEGTNPEGFSNISYLLNKAINRSKEYKNGSFIIIVVGPAKSGKSTLVNLIANNYVSPTHFLECTVRPSIIFKAKDSNSSGISIYKITGDQLSKTEQIDFIIDCIRGIEVKSDETLRSVGIEETIVPLTRENIEKYVQLDLSDNLSEIRLLTAISPLTEQQGLLQNDVFIVDMPGFDGSLANIDDEVYKKIAERSDLVVFVQSSNAAMSKVSKQFLTVLKENNKGVPVCLIHNVFDSAYWRKPESKNKEVKEHMDKAKEFITGGDFHFQLEENLCFSVNLGKVTDSRDSQYKDLLDLQKEAEAFKGIEKDLSDRLHDNRDEMRYKVCLSRTKQQVEHLIEMIAHELEERNKKRQHYQNIERTYNDLIERIGKSHVEKPLAIDNAIISEAQAKFFDAVDLYLRTHPFVQRMWTPMAKVHLESCMAKGEDVVTSFIRNLVVIQSKERELFDIYSREILEIEDVANDVAIKKEIEKHKLQKLCVSEISNVSLNAHDAETLIALIGNITSFFGIYVRRDRLTDCINRRAIDLAGVPGNSSTNNLNTPLAMAISKVFQETNEKFDEFANKYNQNVYSILEKIKKEVLSKIISDFHSFNERTESINSLIESLRPVNSSLSTPH